MIAAAVEPDAPLNDDLICAMPEACGDATEADESGLLRRLQRGDDEAYEIVVRRHGGRMLRTARRLLADEDLAREAVQDAFLSAFRSIDRFREDARLSTWLHRIVVNAALMKLRRSARHPEVSLDGLLSAFAGDGHHVHAVRGWDLPIDAELMRGEVCALVRRMIDRLPSTSRTIIILRDIEELSVTETARMLGVSENAVKIRLHRAHQALQTLLEPCFARA